MAEKKKNKPDILQEYMKYVLENGEAPRNVYQFAQSLKLKEVEFYEQFGSFENIEKKVFQSFFDHCMTLLHKNQEYHDFDPQNKLLSFYFTFFEILKANRSYVKMVLDTSMASPRVMRQLSEFKKSFGTFIEGIDIKTIDLKIERLDKFQDRGIKELSWAQLLVTLRFWLNDDSPGFEKTDLFIEKSLKVGFNLLDNELLKGVIDLGKFLVKEKMM